MNTAFFRVDRSGPTIDGRVITPQEITDMAATYDPETYGARVWLEHCRTVYPDGSFMAYGDVTALDARPGPNGILELFASINPTPELLAIKQARQKVYWSVEIAANFAGSGKAYLIGLAMTDSPASLGTEAWKFSHTLPQETRMSAPLADPPDSPPETITPTLEVATGTTPATDESFLRKFKALFAADNGKTTAVLSDHEQAMGLLAEKLSRLDQDSTAHSGVCLLENIQTVEG